MYKIALTSVALLAIWSAGVSATTMLSIGECELSAGCIPVTIPGFATNPSATGIASVTGFVTGDSIWTITATATGSPPLTPPTQLDTNTITVASSGPGTLLLDVTQQGLTSPLGANVYNSGFTVNSLSGTFSVTEMTLNDPANGLYSTVGLTPADLLSEHPFSGPITTATGVNAAATSLSDSSPFSVSTEYVITATGGGSANLTINLASDAPEPASITLLGTALLGLGWLARRHSRQV